MRVLLGLVFAAALGVASLTAPPTDRLYRECFVFWSPRDVKPLTSDSAECAVATSPASTFKIPHALIALQTGVIQPTSVFKWDGTRYEYESWRRDHTLDSAIKWSLRPIFERTARLIGPTRMHESLAALHYAADTFEGEGNPFWVDGDLVVSPLEQIAFLRRFFANTLPVDERYLALVRDALRMPEGQITLGAGPHPFVLDRPGARILGAKTGNTTVKGERVSWLVGALEMNGETSVFAARVRTSGTLASTAGADLALRRLKTVRTSRPATGPARL